MRRYSHGLSAVCLGVLLTAPLLGANLDPYLIKANDRPSDCQPAQGFYPVDQKLASFFDYKIYRVAVPPVVDRHAQSFQCGPDKGTLYFFLYAQAREAEMAEMFLHGILSHASPTPAIENFKNGFVVLSFAQPPTSLVEIVHRKISGSTKAISAPIVPVAVSSSPVTVSTAAVPVPTPTQTPTRAPAIVQSTVPLPTPPVPVVTPPPVVKIPVVVPEVARVSVPRAAGQAMDLSGEVPEKFLKELECSAKDIPNETREACGLISAFRKGTSIEPVISTGAPRIGVAYHIDSFGQLNDRTYLSLLGSGRAGEVALFPLPIYDGVEEMEVQALITARQKKQELPLSNEMTSRISKHPLPSEKTLIPTKGISYQLLLVQKKNGYIRRSGDRWIMIIVNGDYPDQQTRSEVVVAEFE